MAHMCRKRCLMCVKYRDTLQRCRTVKSRKIQVRLHLQTVMQTIAICNPSRRSNGYTIYTLCIGVQKPNLMVWGWKSHRLLQTVESSQMSEYMMTWWTCCSCHGKCTPWNLKDPFRESSGRSKRKRCFAKIPTRHPLIIKWCLYMQHRSSGAYETLRSSGLLKLPSQRTL